MENIEVRVEPCKNCQGSGKKKDMVVLRDEICRECKGTGSKPQARKVLCG